MDTSAAGSYMSPELKKLAVLWGGPAKNKSDAQMIVIYMVLRSPPT